MGNIYIGGTGKTPACIIIYIEFRRLKLKSIFIKKYYQIRKMRGFIKKMEF